ncbi:hypothetical protein IE53DRAFT_387155 [Violaceomyces palustris]|uniref:Uncharacterized protein n=1 Tax=Violaceomyces palustris TaxID=1673888 RepID=A0ACD0NXF9_9BASI|nr:hypothetical protein IE53DRAFT_387155 [Violaceomyces palustris]
MIRSLLKSRASSLKSVRGPGNGRAGLLRDLSEITRHFWHLGFTSFGGPGVHVVIFRRRFVDQLKWLDSTTFADLFALGNALPGPGSTQLLFSIAVSRSGAIPGLYAFFLWSLPGAVGMAALAAGVKSFPTTLPPIVLALLTGLNAAAVGLIALAAFQLSKAAITDSLTRILVLGAASFGICYHAPWMYPVLVFGGGIMSLLFDYRLEIKSVIQHSLGIRKKKLRADQPDLREAGGSMPENVELEAIAGNDGGSARREDIQPEEVESKNSADGRDVAEAIQGMNGSSQQDGDDSPSAAVSLRRRNNQSVSGSDSGPASQHETAEERQTAIVTPSPVWAWAMGGSFILLIIVMVVVRAKLASPPRTLDFVTNMIIAGVIIFGGGPVVIPLLRGYTVDNGCVSSRDFLLGFAILQAFPGPNFNFATYLGLLSVPNNPVLGALLGYIGIFSPGILLKLSLLPLYASWRRNRVAKSILRGLNAAAAGLVYTAVWQLFLGEQPFSQIKRSFSLKAPSVSKLSTSFFNQLVRLPSLPFVSFFLLLLGFAEFCDSTCESRIHIHASKRCPQPI